MRLLIITNERISELAAKGCLTKDYYNPDGLYKSIAVMLLHNEMPDAKQKKAFEITCGDAKVYYRAYPVKSKMILALTLWIPCLIESYIKMTIDRVFIALMYPDIIRAEGCEMCAFVASIIKKIYGIPYIRKLGNNPDTDIRPYAKGLSRILYFFSNGIEKIGTRNADMNICISSPIAEYVQKRGGKYIVLHNVTDAPVVKSDYKLHSPIRIVSINRVIPGKDPLPIYNAIDILRRRGYSIHIRLISGGVPNAEIMKYLHTYDIAVFRSDYNTISKGVIECAKAGLPIIHNYLECQEVQKISVMVDPEAMAYANAIEFFIRNGFVRKVHGIANNNISKMYCNDSAWRNLQLNIIRNAE